MHTFLSLSWEEWGSITAIVTGVCMLANSILKRTVKIPLESLKTELQQFRESETNAREKLSNDIGQLSDRVSRAEGRIDGYDEQISSLNMIMKDK